MTRRMTKAATLRRSATRRERNRLIQATFALPAMRRRGAPVLAGLARASAAARRRTAGPGGGQPQGGAAIPSADSASGRASVRNACWRVVPTAAARRVSRS